jgi:hypothetical protein
MEKCLLHLTKNCHEPTARNSKVFTEDVRNVIKHATSAQHCFHTVSNNKTPTKTALKLTARIVGAFQIGQATPGLLETLLKF